MILDSSSNNMFFRLENFIDKAKSILLVIHQFPDGDAIGSMIAMMEYLAKKGKQYTAFSVDRIPSNFLFLKNAYRVTSKLDDVRGSDFDLAVVLDCSSLEYTGIKEQIDLIKQKSKGLILAVVDHHRGNQGFGDLNIIDNQAAATSVIIHRLFKKTGVPISKQAASGMLLGILTDTTNFTNDATSPEALALAAELTSLSGKYNYIIRMANQGKGMDDLNVWGRVLSRLKKNDRLNIAYSVILAEDFKLAKVETLDGISNFFNNLADIKFVMIVKEQKNNELKVSLRAIEEGVDVLPLAEFFQGGGHSRSAGFTIKGRLEKVGGYWQVV